MFVPGKVIVLLSYQLIKECVNSIKGRTHNVAIDLRTLRNCGTVNSLYKMYWIGRHLNFELSAICYIDSTALNYSNDDLKKTQGLGMVWYGMVWYGMVWYGMVWYGMVWYGMVWCVWCSVVWCGMVWYGMVWYGMVWHGMVWYGMVWFVMVWYGMVWYGMVWYGMVWYGMV